MLRLLRLLCVIHAAYICGGCGALARDPAAGQARSAYWDSEYYRLRTRHLKLSLEDAGLRLQQYLIQNGDAKDKEELRFKLGDHYLLVGDSYLFTPIFLRTIKQGFDVPLWGYYVDGNTGAVHFERKDPITLEHSISVERQQQLWGETATESPEWKRIVVMLIRETPPNFPSTSH